MPNDRFQPVATIRDPDGPEVVITQRVDTKKHSFALRKEFLGPDGTPSKSVFFNRRHIPALRRLLDEAEAWLDAEEDRAGVRARAATAR